MKKLRARLQFFGLLAGGLLLILQFRSGLITLHEKNIKIGVSYSILLALLLIILSICSQVIAWFTAMKSLGINLPLRGVFEGFFLSFLPRYIPGSIWGYLSRNEWLQRYYGVSYKTSNQGSILETLSAIFANIIIIGLSGVKKNWLDWGVVIIISVLLPVTYWLLSKKIANLNITNRFHLRTILHFIFLEFNLRNWLISIFFFMILWLLYGCVLMLLVNFLFPASIPFTVRNILQLSSFYAIAWLVGFLIIFAPAGSGFREYILTSLLINGLQITMGQSSIISILLRLLIVFSELLLVGMSILMNKNVLRKRIIRKSSG